MKKQRNSLKKWKKTVAIVLITVLISLVAFFTIIFINTIGNSNHPVTPAKKETEYLDFEKSNIKDAVERKVTITPIDGFNGESIRKRIDKRKGFSFSKYYDFDTVFEIMKSSKINKTENLDLLNSDNSIDADKLYNTVLHNNEMAKQGTGKNRLNTFYSDAEPEEIRKICDLTAKTINETQEDKDIKETASLLSRLKIFRHNTSTSLAAVTQNITFYFNPTMIDITRTTFELSGRKNKDYDEEILTFVHEIEHLKQYCSSDDNQENGMEAGFCRKYDNATVNSLWIQWILEAAAEMKMAEYLNTTPMNYAKKITYVNSYNLGYIFNDDVSLNSLINSTFENDLEAAFKKLNINSEAAQKDFLNLMYSIEITQYDCNDFWEYYQKKTGKTLSDEERASMRMDIRTDAIYRLTEKYYDDLIRGIESGKIKDLETVFYMMKLWELDCCGHLAYTQKEAFEHAEQFLVYLEEIHTLMFDALSECTGQNVKEISEYYNTYHPLITENRQVKRNYRFYNLDEKKGEFIDDCFNGYSVTYFSDVNSILNKTQTNT